LVEFSLFLTATVVWLCLQGVAIWKLRGGWRLAAWLSVAAMGFAVAMAVFGVLAGSNLAPIWVVFALPVCLVWVVMLWIVRWASGLITR
jgi:hypothetical protein